MVVLLRKSGTFAKKSDGTGTQSVTGLGFEPKALFLWCADAFVSGTWNSRGRLSVGIADGDDAYAIGFDITTVNQSGSLFSQTCQAMAAKGLQILQNVDDLVAECDISFDADGFTLDWTLNDHAFAPLIGYLALGGDAIESVKCVSHTAKTTTTGTKAVTGVGFEGNFAFHIFAGAPDALPMLQAWSVNECLGFGAMTSSGEWAIAVNLGDGSLTPNASRAQITSKAIHFYASGGSAEGQADFSSWDADGFTLNWTDVGTGSQIASMVIKFADDGLVQVGNFAKSTDAAPATNTVTGLGGSAAALLLASFMRTASASARNDDLNIGIGASDLDGGDQCVAVTAEDGVDNNQDNVAVTNKAFIKVDNWSRTIEAQATAASQADGADVTWDTNDSVAADICYVMFGPGGAAPMVAEAAISYGSFTRTGVNNTPWRLTFTPSDEDTLGVDALTWEVWTGAARTGTKVAEGTCTSGVEEVADIAYNADGLVNGSQTLYLSIDDGDQASDDTELTLKRDDDAPAASTSIEVTAV